MSTHSSRRNSCRQTCSNSSTEKPFRITFLDLLSMRRWVSPIELTCLLASLVRSRSLIHLQHLRSQASIYHRCLRCLAMRTRKNSWNLRRFSFNSWIYRLETRREQKHLQAFKASNNNSSRDPSLGWRFRMWSIFACNWIFWTRRISSAICTDWRNSILASRSCKHFRREDSSCSRLRSARRETMITRSSLITPSWSHSALNRIDALISGWMLSRRKSTLNPSLLPSLMHFLKSACKPSLLRSSLLRNSTNSSWTSTLMVRWVEIHTTYICTFVWFDWYN